jgi:hypothetical protein
MSASTDPAAAASRSAAGPRSRKQRQADTLGWLTAPAADAWVASAGADGPYLVPLSVVWTGDRLVLAVAAASRTARNILTGGTARLGLGHTRDVVMIDAVLDRSVPVADAPDDLAEAYAAQSDWDPREDPGDYRYVLLRPVRIQAWREADELTGRLLMRDGEWLAST